MTDTEDSRTAAGGLMVGLSGSVVVLAFWSSWTRFDLLPAAASRLSGVYLVATATGLVGVSMAGDRRGTGLRRMTGWAALAMREAGLWLCWATTADRAATVELGEHVFAALREQRLGICVAP